MLIPAKKMAPTQAALLANHPPTTTDQIQSLVQLAKMSSAAITNLLDPQEILLTVVVMMKKIKMEIPARKSILLEAAPRKTPRKRTQKKEVRKSLEMIQLSGLIPKLQETPELPWWETQEMEEDDCTSS